MQDWYLVVKSHIGAKWSKKLEQRLFTFIFSFSCTIVMQILTTLLDHNLSYFLLYARAAGKFVGRLFFKSVYCYLKYKGKKATHRQFPGKLTKIYQRHLLTSG